MDKRAVRRKLDKIEKGIEQMRVKPLFELMETDLNQRRELSDIYEQIGRLQSLIDPLAKRRNVLLVESQKTLHEIWRVFGVVHQGSEKRGLDEYTEEEKEIARNRYYSFLKPEEKA